jgi:hypothetical protein
MRFDRHREYRRMCPRRGRNRPFILPVFGMKSRFTIAGARCTLGGFGCIAVRCEPVLG